MLLRRDAPDPLYIQIKEYILGEIKAGRFQPDQRLPSERELSQQFQVGRMTVRQALVELMHEGKTYTRMGKGTFVLAPKIDQQLRALTGFSQDVRIRGGEPSSRVLEAKVAPVSPAAARALRLTPEEKMIVLTRLRLSDGIPLAIESAHLPYALFPNLLDHNFAVDSLYAVLRNEYDVVLVQAEQTLEAALATHYESEMLSLTPPSAVLKMERLTYNQEGRPVEYVPSTYRGDRYKFRSVLQMGTAFEPASPASPAWSYPFER
jgi:GntR family transcriptional regulator